MACLSLIFACFTGICWLCIGCVLRLREIFRIIDTDITQVIHRLSLDIRSSLIGMSHPLPFVPCVSGALLCWLSVVNLWGIFRECVYTCVRLAHDLCTTGAC